MGHKRPDVTVVDRALQELTLVYFRCLVDKRGWENHQILSSGKENQEDVSNVDGDCAVGGWLFGCGVWSVGGFFERSWDSR